MPFDPDREVGAPLPVGDDSMLSLDLRKLEAPPWSGWDVVLVAFVFVAVTMAGLMAALYVAYRKHLSLESVGTDARVVVPIQGVAYVMTLLLMWLLATRSYRRRFWPAVQWKWPPLGTSLTLVFTGAPLAVVLEWVQSHLPMPSSLPMEKLFRTPTDAMLMAAMAVVAAPVMEELFFRGFLYPVLRRSGVVWGILGTAIAFALVHGSQYGWAWAALLVLFIVGLVLTLVRAHTGSVAASCLLHVGYNLTLFILLYISTDHFRHLERAR